MIVEGEVPQPLEELVKALYNSEQVRPVLFEKEWTLPEFYRIHKARYAYMWTFEPQEVTRFFNRKELFKRLPPGVECTIDDWQNYTEAHINLANLTE